MRRSAHHLTVLTVILVGLGSCKKGETPAPTAPPAATPADAQANASANDAGAGSATNSASSPGVEVFSTSQGSLTMTPIQHATVLFGWAGKAIYIDPVVDAHDQGMPLADLILITHVHPDHLSRPVILKLRKQQTQVIAPAAVAQQLSMDGVRVMENGATQTVLGIGVEAVPMYNLTRGPAEGRLFHPKGEGNGYVLTFGDTRVYLSGDTECTPEMKALKNIDVALVCMNLPYTMPPAEAAACIKAFQPKVLYPYHYRGSNLDDLRAGLAGSEVDVRIRNWYP